MTSLLDPVWSEVEIKEKLAVISSLILQVGLTIDSSLLTGILKIKMTYYTRLIPHTTPYLVTFAAAPTFNTEISDREPVLIFSWNIFTGTEQPDTQFLWPKFPPIDLATTS